MLTEPRIVFEPFEYYQAYQYWERQSQAHWLHLEVPMASDIHDFKLNLTPSERNVVGNVLKGFAQTEVVVNDYWSKRVSGWFPKPEINMMTSAFGYMETVHAKAYAYLNESLGLDDFSAFLEEPSAKEKIDALLEVTADTPSEIARSLAVFSGFAEGVQLFSSFAVLMNFSRYNKMKGVGQIVAFSVRDESMHSEGGCWLFRQYMAERPDLFTDELRLQVVDAARNAVRLEDAFIDHVFELGEIDGLDPRDLKAYIRFRANTKLGDLGVKPNWRNINPDALERMKWFDYLTAGTEQQDFFAQRPSSYSKGVTLIDDSIFA